MKPRKSQATQYIFVFIIIGFILIFFALHLGTVQGDREISIFEILNDTIIHMEGQPFDIKWTSSTSRYLLLLLSILGMAAVMVQANYEREKRRLPGKEQGSAQWNTSLKAFNKKYNEPYGKPTSEGKNNIILTQTVRIGMDNAKASLTTNVLVIGGTGSGKTFFFVKPNVLQANCSYVITDPSGELIDSVGTFLKDQGYKIKIFNLVEMEHSNMYNPFFYIRDENGVKMMINCLIKNTNPKDARSGDPFWEKSETALLQALVFYLVNYCPPEMQNFSTIMDLLRMAQIDENNPMAESKLDQIFFAIEKKDPSSLAVKNYRTFKMGAGKTLKSILISAAVRLTVFDFPLVKKLTDNDNIDLTSLADEKQALFIIIPAADDTYNFLVSMMYSQLFESLYFHAEKECLFQIRNNTTTYCSADSKKRAERILELAKQKKLKIIPIRSGRVNLTDQDDHILVKNMEEKNAETFLENCTECNIVSQKKKELPNPIRFILDEFANVGQIPNFPEKLATMRKYAMSCSIILQSITQIQKMYEKDWGSIVGNCDSLLYLGGNDLETMKYISEELGKCTILSRNSSRTRGSKGSSSLSYNNIGRELMTPEEIRQLPSKDCILLVRGERPFYDKKYFCPKHKNYPLTADANPEKIFSYKTMKEYTPSIASDAAEKINLHNTKLLEQYELSQKKTKEKIQTVQQNQSEYKNMPAGKFLQERNVCISTEEMKCRISMYNKQKKGKPETVPINTNSSSEKINKREKMDDNIETIYEEEEVFSVTE